MAKTKKDIADKERMIEMFKEYKSMKMEDGEIVAGVAGILGLSYRTIYEHFKSWKAQKKLGLFKRKTLKDKIKDIVDGN